MSQVWSDFVKLWIEVWEMSHRMRYCIMIELTYLHKINNSHREYSSAMMSQDSSGFIKLWIEVHRMRYCFVIELTYLHKIYNSLREYFYCHSYNMQLNFLITQSVPKSELPSSLILNRTLSKYG